VHDSGSRLVWPSRQATCLADMKSAGSRPCTTNWMALKRQMKETSWIGVRLGLGFG